MYLPLFDTRDRRVASRSPPPPAYHHGVKASRHFAGTTANARAWQFTGDKRARNGALSLGLFRCCYEHGKHGHEWGRVPLAQSLYLLNLSWLLHTRRIHPFFRHHTHRSLKVISSLRRDRRNSWKLGDAGRCGDTTRQPQCRLIGFRCTRKVCRVRGR